ncbi:MAG TPA: ATP-dependent DNA helicase [Candidatus Paceibacterota bacterium]
MFDELYKKLNAKQKEAVDTIEGPVMVIAGPGTGKTTILTLRIANILKKTDTPPSGILAITFTEAGVKAMRQKLKDVIGARAHEVRIHTFHGFAAAVIHEHKDHFVHLEGVKQMTDIDAESAIRDLLKKESFGELRPFGNPDFYIQKILGAIRDAKKEALMPSMVREYAKKESERVKNDESSISTRGASKGKLKAEALKAMEKCDRTIIFADVYEAYEAWKRKEKMMDFDDLLIELLVALKSDELLLRLLQEKFLYILVDEHQDTNDAQNLIVRQIADFFDAPNLFVVGDEKQAVYRFQGASVENFLKFQSVWKDMKIIQLDTNYRSTTSLLDGSFAMIENNYAEGEHAHLRIKLQAGREEESKKIDVVEADSTAAAEAYLGEELQRITKEEPQASVAILTKTNRDLERVLRFLEKKGVPVASERNIDIFKHPIGNLFFEIIEFLSDGTRVDSLSKTLSAGLWGLSFEQSVECIKRLRSGTFIDLEKNIPAFRTLQKEITSDGAVAFIIRAASMSGFIDRVARDPNYVEVWRGITTLSEYIAREKDIRDPRELLKELLAYRAASESRSVKVSVGTPDLPIRAMTAHASKGLEFDYVFIAYATEESWVGRSRGVYFVLPQSPDEGDDIKDARRLFYVALTRARKHATILYSLLEAGGTPLSPLRFIAEISETSSTFISLPALNETPLVEDSVTERPPQMQKILEYAQSVLTRSGLSVTALNHFLECPNAFLYQSILKIPQAPNGNSEKGNAMHEAMARVWGSKDKSEGNIEHIIKESVASYFESSLLPAFEKESVKKELLENAPMVAKALVSHFAVSGTTSSESWSESEFETVYAEKTVRIPIHGKLDAIVDMPDEVLVFDYKTREALTPAAIKGETKSSDGNYFRQLVFYKMLLANDHRYKEKRITPSLVFLSPDSKGRCPSATLPIGEEDLEKVRQEIHLLIESVWSGRIAKEGCNDRNCEWCRLKASSL